MWSGAHHNSTLLEPNRKRFFQAPAHWPKNMDNILNVKKTWPRPTAVGYMESTCSWQWWLAYHAGAYDGCRVLAANHAQVFSPRTIIGRHDNEDKYMVLHVSHHAIVVGALVPCCERSWRFDMGPGSIRFMFVTDFRQYSVTPWRRELSDGVGVVFRADGANMPVAHAVLLSGRKLDKTLLKELHGVMETPQEAQALEDMTTNQLFETLCAHVFGGAADLIAAAVQSFLKPQEDPTWKNAETCEVVEEMMMHDPNNLSELKEVKQALRSKEARELNQLRNENRALKAARAKAKSSAKAKAAKAKAKAVASAGAAPKAAPVAAPVGPILPLGLPDPAPSDPASSSGDLHPVAPEAPPPPSAPEEPPPHPSEPSAPSEPRVVLFRTPVEALEGLSPPGVRLSIDQNSCRWRGRFNGVDLPSVSFGPKSGNSRRQSLELMLEQAWIHTGAARPAHPRVDDVDPAAWDGVLDDREEKPKKYVKK